MESETNTTITHLTINNNDNNKQLSKVPSLIPSSSTTESLTTSSSSAINEKIKSFMKVSTKKRNTEVIQPVLTCMTEHLSRYTIQKEAKRLDDEAENEKGKKEINKIKEYIKWRSKTQSSSSITAADTDDGNNIQALIEDLSICDPYAVKLMKAMIKKEREDTRLIKLIQRGRALQHHIKNRLNPRFHLRSSQFIAQPISTAVHSLSSSKNDAKHGEKNKKKQVDQSKKSSSSFSSSYSSATTTTATSVVKCVDTSKEITFQLFGDNGVGFDAFMESSLDIESRCTEASYELIDKMEYRPTISSLYQESNAGAGDKGSIRLSIDILSDMDHFFHLLDVLSYNRFLKSHVVNYKNGYRIGYILGGDSRETFGSLEWFSNEFWFTIGTFAANQIENKILLMWVSYLSKIPKQIQSTIDEDSQKYTQAIKFLQEKPDKEILQQGMMTAKVKVAQRLKRWKNDMKIYPSESNSSITNSSSTKDSNQERTALIHSIEKLTSNSAVSDDNAKMRKDMLLNECDASMTFATNEWDFTDFHEIYSILYYKRSSTEIKSSFFAVACELRLLVNFMQLFQKKYQPSPFSIALKEIDTFSAEIAYIVFSSQFDAWQNYLNKDILSLSSFKSRISHHKPSKQSNRQRRKSSSGIADTSNDQTSSQAKEKLAASENQAAVGKQELQLFPPIENQHYMNLKHEATTKKMGHVHQSEPIKTTSALISFEDISGDEWTHVDGSSQKRNKSRKQLVNVASTSHISESPQDKIKPLASMSSPSMLSTGSASSSQPSDADMKSQIEKLSEAMKKMKNENEELINQLKQLKEKMNMIEGGKDLHLNSNDQLGLSQLEFSSPSQPQDAHSVDRFGVVPINSQPPLMLPRPIKPLERQISGSSHSSDPSYLSPEGIDQRNMFGHLQDDSKNMSMETSYGVAGLRIPYGDLGITSASSVCSINSEPYSEDESGSISSQWWGWQSQDLGFQHHFYQHQHHHAAGLLSANPWMSHHQQSTFPSFLSNQHLGNSFPSSPPPQLPIANEWNHFSGNKYGYMVGGQQKYKKSVDFHSGSRLSSRSSSSSVANHNYYHHLPPMPHEWHGREKLSNSNSSAVHDYPYHDPQSSHPMSGKRRTETKARPINGGYQNSLSRTLSGTITLNSSIQTPSYANKSRGNNPNSSYFPDARTNSAQANKEMEILSSSYSGKINANRGHSGDAPKMAVKFNYNHLNLRMVYHLPPIPHSVSSLVKITKAIRSFEQHCREERQKRLAYENEVLLKMRSIVCGVWPRARVIKFGSCATGLTLPNSDMDLVICLPRVMSNVVKEEVGPLEGTAGGESQNTLLWQEKLKAALLLSPLVNKETLKTIIHAPVPIISLEFKTGIPIRVDISIETATHRGIAASKFIGNLLREYPMLQPMVLILKRFISEKGFGVGYSGGLSSYALTLIVACFLEAINHGNLKFKPVSKNESGVRDDAQKETYSSMVRARSASVSTFPVKIGGGSPGLVGSLSEMPAIQSFETQHPVSSTPSSTHSQDAPKTISMATSSTQQSLQDRKARVSFDDDMLIMMKDRVKAITAKKMEMDSTSLSPVKRGNRASSSSSSSSYESSFTLGTGPAIGINHVEDYELGSLFIRFLHFFGEVFNPKTTGISISKSFFDRSAPIVNHHQLLSSSNLGISSTNSETQAYTSINPHPQTLETSNDVENNGVLISSSSAMTTPSKKNLSSKQSLQTPRFNSVVVNSAEQASHFDPAPPHQEYHHMQQSAVFRYDPLQIEDPLQPGNNVGRNCFRIYQIQREFHSAATLIDQYNELNGESIIKNLLGQWS